MGNQFKTEAEIEHLLKRYDVPLKDSSGNTYDIDADRLTWHWFLILTSDPDFKPEDIVDDVLEWQKTEQPGQELSYLFSQYIAYLTDLAGPEVTDELWRNFKKAEAHPLFDTKYFSTGRS